MTYTYHLTRAAAEAAVITHRAAGRMAYSMQHHVGRWEVRSWS